MVSEFIASFQLNGAVIVVTPQKDLRRCQLHFAFGRGCKKRNCVVASSNPLASLLSVISGTLWCTVWAHILILNLFYLFWYPLVSTRFSSPWSFYSVTCLERTTDGVLLLWWSPLMPFLFCFLTSKNYKMTFSSRICRQDCGSCVLCSLVPGRNDSFCV